MKLFVILIMLITSITAHSFEYEKWEVTDPQNKAKGETALERWQSINTANYIYLIRESCWCRPSYLTKVVVINNKVVFAEPMRQLIPSDQILPLNDYKTVEGLFRMIEEYVNDKPDEFERRIDYSLHYPSKFSVDPALHSMDDEYQFEIIELVFIKKKKA